MLDDVIDAVELVQDVERKRRQPAVNKVFRKRTYRKRPVVDFGFKFDIAVFVFRPNLRLRRLHTPVDPDKTVGRKILLQPALQRLFKKTAEELKKERNNLILERLEVVWKTGWSFKRPLPLAAALLQIFLYPCFFVCA